MNFIPPPRKKQQRTAVLIPCYNEAQTIKKVVEDFKCCLPDAHIFVYDNNSTDGTDRIADEAGATVRHEYKQGKGNVLRSMFRDIEADCYILVDGDDTYPAENAKEMQEIVLSGCADMVIGDRLSSTYYQENKRPFHNFGNKLVKALINRLFCSNVNDIMTGYRAFSRPFVKNFPVLSKGFEIETEMTIHALDKNFHIREIPVKYRDRPEGSTSKLNTFADGVKVILTIFRLYRDYKPFLFFSALSLSCITIAAILFTPIFLEYIYTGLVPRFPTLIVCGFLVILGFMLFTCGLILDVINNKSRQLFEILMNNRTTK